MKSKSAVPLLMLLVLGAIFGYSGCTAIGFGIGAAVDSSKPDYDTIPGWRAGSIKRGNDITLTKKNGEKLKGEYLGLDTVAASQYAELYNEVRERYQKDIPLPAVGDSISFIILNSGREHKGEFSGFENQYILVRQMGIRGMVNGKIDMNNLERITDKNGNLIEVRKLKNLSLEGKIPVASTVTVKTDSDTLRVPTATVSQIEIPSDKNAKWVGLGIGAVVDVAIVVAASRSMSNWGGNWNWNWK